MRELPIRELLSDRIWRNGALIVLCLVSVLSLESQSAASFSTYILALVMLAGYQNWKDVFHSYWAWLVTGLLGYLAASSLWSDPFSAAEFRSILIRAVLVFLFVIALAECQLRGQVQRWLAQALALVGFVAVSAAIVVFLVTSPDDGRLNGLGQLDNHVVAALVWSVLLVFALHLLLNTDKTAWRLVGVLSALMYVVAIYLSDSRTAWVAGALGAATIVSAHAITSRRLFIGFVFAAAGMIAVVAIIIANLPSAPDWLLPRGASFRPDIWASALDRISPDHWLFGLGILTSDDFQIGSQLFAHPHNMYLSMLYQGGVVALVLFLALLIGCALWFLRNYDHRDAKIGLSVLAVTIPAYLLDGHELIDKVGDTWFLVWLPVGLMLGFAWRGEVVRRREDL